VSPFPPEEFHRHGATTLSERPAAGTDPGPSGVTLVNAIDARHLTILDASWIEKRCGRAGIPPAVKV